MTETKATTDEYTSTRPVADKPLPEPPCGLELPCPIHDHTPEPTRFAWFHDGKLVAGNLSQWARMWEGDYYAGDNDLTHCLLSWDGRPHTAEYHGVTTTRGIKGEDDWIPYTFTVPGFHDTVTVSIDGRA